MNQTTTGLQSSIFYISMQFMFFFQAAYVLISCCCNFFS